MAADAGGWRRDAQVELVHSELTKLYGGNERFCVAAAFRMCQSHSDVFPVTYESFTQALDALVASRRLACSIGTDQTKVYSHSDPMKKRKNANDALPQAIEAIRRQSFGRRATIRDIEASGRHLSQMLRTAIDVTLGLGLVKPVGMEPQIEIEWNEGQEQALLNCASVTLEIQELRAEIDELDQKIAKTKLKIARATAEYTQTYGTELPD